MKFLDFFKSVPTEIRPERFSGEGTVLMAHVTGLGNLASILPPAELVDFLHEHQNAQQRIITAHGGVTYLFAGDAIVAYWRCTDSKLEPANHAFHAARELLAQANETIDYRVCLGSGSLAGAYFGPVEQFQVIGRAMTEATLLSRIPFSAHRAIMFAQSTKALLPEGKFSFAVVDTLPDSVLVFTFVP